MSQYEMKTVRGYLLAEVVSALQKSIRRNDRRKSAYFAIEMIESGYYKYLWRRLFVISAEDCFGIITQEIEALYNAWFEIQGKPEAILFGVKAALILSMSEKSRDADHANLLGYKKGTIPLVEIQQAIEEVRKELIPIPDAALDCHTKVGRIKGKTKRDFLLQEFDSLKPRQVGLFDVDLEQVRSNKIKF